MKLNIILCFIHFVFIIYFPNEVNSCSSYEIIKGKNNITDTNAILELINYFNNFNDKSQSEDIMTLIFQFISKYTNIVEAKMIDPLWDCIRSIDFEGESKKNFLGIIGFSGKGVSDLGLEEECLRNEYI